MTQLMAVAERLKNIQPFYVMEILALDVMLTVVLCVSTTLALLVSRLETVKRLEVSVLTILLVTNLPVYLAIFLRLLWRVLLPYLLILLKMLSD